MTERHVEAVVAICLVTIHPTPGPGGRDKTEEGKAARRERRRKRRSERREARRSAEVAAVSEGVREEVAVVTWNVQRMSMVSGRRRKARAVAEVARQSGWDVVLLSELRAEGDGVVWMGDDDHRVVIVHSRRAGVLLRGEMLKR